ncbi:DUF3634 family protein [Vibrio gazogenes]|uniref:DUF3634 domain-containing protein n=1 Tax=Vibrio gazogenes TaxID=687 RepID=A0A1Z2SBA9_VIBGA|nr:DUF3634 family protein [Vibrio gazogenes]ASA54411.1 hypothetical protein BSQ33_00830 [Vibrio gazogenes]
MMYVIIIAAVVIFWLLVLDRPVLYVHFKKGELVKVKGHLPVTLKHNLTEIGHHSPFDGYLKAYQRREGIRLKFSPSVPKSIQQRIRNVFPFSGLKKSGINQKNKH